MADDKSKPAKRQGRKATGPRFLRDASNDATKDPKTAGLPSLVTLMIWAEAITMKILKSAVLLVCVSCLSLSAQAALVAYYPFNGNANDESVNSNDGTVIGATLTAARFGNVDSAYSFDGIDDYMDFGKDASVQFSGTPTMSVFGWVNLSGAATYIGIDKYNSQGSSPGGANIGYYLAFADTGGNTVVRAGFGNGLETKIDATTDISDGDWHHVGWTWDGSLVEIYVDGALDFSQSYTSGIIDNDQALSFAKRIDLPTNIYAGLMDDIRIYDNVLSISDISALFNQSASLPEPGTLWMGLLGFGVIAWIRWSIPK